jgi:acyl-coenzyme A thioesterase 9
MVSLDPVTKAPVNIAPLVLSAPAERTLYVKGEENHKAKTALKEFNIMQKGSRRGG